MTSEADFEPYLRNWDLVPDGEPIVTPRGRLLPVRRQGVPAMLKISTNPEERFGRQLMLYWEGDGAAEVLAHDETALLLERATGPRSLVSIARSGPDGDDEASRIICALADRLHVPRPRQPPELVPLVTWFEALLRAGPSLGGIFLRGEQTARALLSAQRDICVLHADLHHANVLDFGTRGWLAIDPKRVIGERAFEYTTIFIDPDAIGDGGPPVATLPGRFQRQIGIVAAAARLDPARLLRWVFAFATLSAVWCREDDQTYELALAIAAIADSEIARG